MWFSRELATSNNPATDTAVASKRPLVVQIHATLRATKTSTNCPLALTPMQSQRITVRDATKTIGTLESTTVSLSSGETNADMSPKFQVRGIGLPAMRTDML